MDRAAAFAVRQPLAPAFLAVVCGIAFDHALQPPGWAWLTLALAGFPILWRRSAGFAWLALPLAGAWHGHQARTYPPDDIGWHAAPERRLTRVRGWLASAPLVEAPPPADTLTWRDGPRVTFRLRATELADGAGGWRAVSGTVAVSIAAERLPLRPGDAVEAVGWLVAPSGPRNPGEHDAAASYARRRIRATLHAESAEALTPLPRPNAAPWSKRREAWLDVARQRLRNRLGSAAPLAEAALLGDRAALRRDELEPYFESGTVHLLVVSGWHIALAAWLATRLARTLAAGPAGRSLAGFAAAWGYTWLTGAEPPAVRAALVFSAFALAELLRRPAHMLNAGWAAGLAILAWDPTQVFQTGAQLSAVAGAALVLFPWRCVAPRPDGDGLPLPWWRQPLQTLALALAASAIAWLAAAPLVAERFRMFSPVSILLSVLLAPALAFGLVCAAAVACLPDIPWLIPAAATLARAALWVVEALPRWAEHWPGAFCHLAGPPGWWCAGWVAALFLPYLMPGYRRTRRWHARVVVAWLLVGAVAQERARWPAEHAFWQLAVGHGNCGVFRTPEGLTALVDAGGMAGPRLAERTIAPFLWDQGVAGIDAVFLSHADADHFNALPGLARRFRIGAVYVSPQFARLEQPAVAAACAELARRGVPIKFVWAGDVVRLGEATFRVALPGARDFGRDDNSVSLALRLECRGRSVLSTGDLAHEGLARLLASPRQPCDVLAAPHHGSRLSNPPELAAWARPAAAVSSQGSYFRTDLSMYAAHGAATFRTHEDGAVAVRWRRDGLTLETFASRRRQRLP